MIWPSLRSTLFPYTTLFRSRATRERRPKAIHRNVQKHLARCHGVRALRSDRKSTRLNSSHANISYVVFCLKKINAVAVPDIAMVGIGHRRRDVALAGLPLLH